jgi:uncharacterized membrane protein (DUF4010 family)
MKSQGAKSGKWEGWRMITMLLLVTNSGFQAHVGGGIVVMETVVVAPIFQSFSSQNVTVKFRVDRRNERNKFMVNNLLHVKKKLRMLFVELRTCWAFFAFGDCGLFHCDDYCFVSGS